MINVNYFLTNYHWILSINTKSYSKLPYIIRQYSVGDVSIIRKNHKEIQARYQKIQIIIKTL